MRRPKIGKCHMCGDSYPRKKWSNFCDECVDFIEQDEAMQKTLNIFHDHKCKCGVDYKTKHDRSGRPIVRSCEQCLRNRNTFLDTSTYGVAA